MHFNVNLIMHIKFANVHICMVLENNCGMAKKGHNFHKICLGGKKFVKLFFLLLPRLRRLWQQEKSRI
jgi:hypothetical protein